MKKILFLFIIILFNIKIYADFSVDEKPIWAINSDTAYTLKNGYWVIDISGPITYGLSDRIHLGTIFWFWYEKMPNFYCKINLFKENEKNIAISLLYKILTTTYKNNVLYSCASLIFSKQLSEKFFITFDYTNHTLDIINLDENKINLIIEIMKHFTKDKNSTIISTFNASVIYQISNLTRFMCELSIIPFGESEIIYGLSENAFYIQDMYIYSGLGFEWLMGEGKDFILKLSLLGNFFLAYIPYINISYKFK